MYHALFRWFPKSAFSRMMGSLASHRWPPAVLRAVLWLYVRAFRVDMAESAIPLGRFETFNAFFTRPLRPGLRPLDPDPARLVSPVDGALGELGPIARGRLIQAKGMDYALADLLGGDPAAARYEGGSFVTFYLSPRDYHRIHSPFGGRVTRFAYVPGELWTVSPLGLRAVPRVFARNERLISFIETPFGELALVAVGATVVGKIRVVYHGVESNLRGAKPLAGPVAPPYAVERGAELARFELGSSVILL
ncbi:MAG: phosphatidylserine decarboxylase, partial [Candidatus Lambdaproteobacteria bacterium]|nr:phosphatidylserine decarboxylase [Candidatus Lambdaproteobacteria bacterium]